MLDILRRQLDAISDYGLLLSQTGQVLYANPSAQQIWGIPADGGGAGIARFHPAYAQAAAFDKLSRVLQADLPRFEIDCHDHEGQVFRAEITAFYMPHEPAGFIQAFVRNLTTSENTAELLKQYERMLSSTSVLVSMVSPDFRYLAVNDEYLRFFGKTRAEIVGRSIDSLHGPEKAEMIKDTLRESLAGRALATAHGVPRADGAIRMMESWQAPARDEQGNVVGVVVTTRDATRARSLRAAVLELARSERLREGDVRAIAEEICNSAAEALKLPLVEVWLNDQREQPQRLVARSSIPADPPDDLPALMQRLSEEPIVLRHDQPVSERFYTTALQSKDLFAAIRRQGQPIGFLRLTTTAASRTWHPDELQLMHELVDLLGEAVTAHSHQQLAEQLADARRLESLGLQTGGLTHDFRNLLLSLSGHLETLARHLPATQEAGDALALAREEAQRATDLCRQALTTADEDTHLQLGAEVAASVRLLRPGLGPQMEVVGNYATAQLSISMPRTRLHQMISNLLRNAAEAYGDRRGQIRIDISSQPVCDEPAPQLVPARSGPFACIQVADDAGGIQLENWEQVFDPFFSSKGLDRGLGLSNVIDVVRAVGGGLAVRNEPGRGTEFRVLLPCEQPAEAHSEDGARRVLVVDDEEIVRSVAARILESAGYEVAALASGPQALEQVRSGQRFSLAVVDLRMPGMDGLEFLTALRALTPETRAILCSGYAESELVEAARAVPGVHLLSKPYAAADLVAAVERAV